MGGGICRKVSRFGQYARAEPCYEWGIMRKRKSDGESFKATLLAVQKEMAKPRAATSARRAKTKRRAYSAKCLSRG